MRKTLIAALAALSLMACDQNWAQAGEDDPAPTAPDCAGQECEEMPACVHELNGCKYAPRDAGVDAGVNKHSGTHITSGTSGPVPGTVLLYDMCGTYPYTASCHWKHVEYGQRRVFHNPTWTTWSLDTISYIWCGYQLKQVPPTQWIASNTAQVCISGHCVDVSNRVPTNANGCRNGSLHFSDLPLTLNYNEYKHVDFVVSLRDGWISNPMYQVSLELGALSYRD